MNMITQFHNYDNGYIALVNLKLKGLPQTVKVQGNELALKSELHISLICAKKIAALIDDKQPEKIEAGIVDRFKSFVQQTPLNTYSLTTEYRFVERDERKTAIVMVNVPGLDQLFRELRSHYGTELPEQPMHITLYTLQPDRGIGILTQAELKRDSNIIDLDVLKNLSAE